MADNAVSVLNARKLAADAWNRFLRTFLQGMAIDVGVAIAVIIAANVDSITSWQALAVMGVAIGKTALTSTASYIMRRYLDASKSWKTPLPPLDPTDKAPAWPES